MADEYHQIVTMTSLALSLLSTFLAPPILCLTLLVVCLATVGKSLGLRRKYVATLVRLFEWGQNEVQQERARQVEVRRKSVAINEHAFSQRTRVSFVDQPLAGLDDVPGLSVDRLISCDDGGDTDIDMEEEKPITPKRERGLIKRKATDRMTQRMSCSESPQFGIVSTLTNDSLDFIKTGMEAIVEDEVTSRFRAEDLATWNMLTRTSGINIPSSLFSWRLSAVYLMGFVFRYGVLFPTRCLLLTIGLVFLVVSTAAIGYLPKGSFKDWMNYRVSLISYRICSRAVSAVITFHDKQNRAVGGGICVANHTSPIDAMILACDNCYAFIGQKQGGLLGIVQRANSRATNHIWFERSQANDREAVKRRIKDHSADPSNLPILIFPEGTCINNSAVMQFKKGSFEVGVPIYPVAMKFDPRFGDPFWNSSQQSFLQYMIMMMTSWAIVVDVWYLPKEVMQPDEDGIQFAARVKAMIAEQGGLVDLDWDGNLKRSMISDKQKHKQQELYSQRLTRIERYPSDDSGILTTTHHNSRDTEQCNAVDKSTSVELQLINSEENHVDITPIELPAQHEEDIVHVWLRSVNAVRRSPVFVSVRHLYGIQAEQLPVMALPYSYNVFAHTLCPYDAQYRHDMRRLGRTIDEGEEELKKRHSHVSVEVSSDVEVDYELEVTKVGGIDVTLNKTVELTATPVQPVYVRIHLPEGTDMVVVRVTSDTETCMLVSVQTPTCPIHDLLSNVREASAYQTMSRLAAIPVTRTEYDTMYVVFVVLNNDEECTRNQMHSFVPSDPVSDVDRRKQFVVSLDTKISYNDYVYAIAATVGALFLTFVIAFLSAYFVESADSVVYNEWASQMTRRHRVYQQRLANHPDEATAPSSADIPPPDRRSIVEGSHNYGTLSTGEPGAMPSTTSDEEDMENDEISNRSLDPHVVVLNDRRERRLALLSHSLSVADLAKKNHRTRDNKYRLYLWNILTISCFYALPVVQLVLVWAKQVNKGDQDLCWYNHLCARPLVQLYAFNSVFSNIGYVSLGFLFICLVAYRHMRYRRSSMLNGQPKHPLDNYGLPQHYGLYYAIGVAIMMEGVLSAAYHICPSPDNYQFDTAFMYMIGVLGILQTYALRHPDINANAHVTFALMAAVILTAMSGVYFHGVLFWVLFGAAYLLLILLVSLEFYYKGSWSVFDTGDSLSRWRARIVDMTNDDASSLASDDHRPIMTPSDSPSPHRRHPNAPLDDSLMITASRRSTSAQCCRRPRRIVSRGCRMLLPHYPKRFVGVVLGAAANVALMVIGVMRRPGDFPSYLLIVFIMNLILYFFQYLLMKLINGERIRAAPLLMLLLSTFTWAGSMYFFLQHVTDWSLPPAASRALNHQCVLLNFYDYHDLWHFLSAVSLFLSFSIILKLDDDTRMTPRGAILVF